jgi:hypothetical protein
MIDQLVDIIWELWMKKYDEFLMTILLLDERSVMVNIVGHIVNKETDTKPIREITMDAHYIPTHNWRYVQFSTHGVANGPLPLAF